MARPSRDHGGQGQRGDAQAEHDRADWRAPVTDDQEPVKVPILGRPPGAASFVKAAVAKRSSGVARDIRRVRRRSPRGERQLFGLRRPWIVRDSPGLLDDAEHAAEGRAGPGAGARAQETVVHGFLEAGTKALAAAIEKQPRGHAGERCAAPSRAVGSLHRAGFPGSERRPLAQADPGRTRCVFSGSQKPGPGLRAPGAGAQSSGKACKRRSGPFPSPIRRLKLVGSAGSFQPHRNRVRRRK